MGSAKVLAFVALFAVASAATHFPKIGSGRCVAAKGHRFIAVYKTGLDESACSELCLKQGTSCVAITHAAKSSNLCQLMAVSAAGARAMKKAWAGSKMFGIGLRDYCQSKCGGITRTDNKAGHSCHVPTLPQREGMHHALERVGAGQCVDSKGKVLAALTHKISRSVCQNFCVKHGSHQCVAVTYECADNVGTWTHPTAGSIKGCPWVDQKVEHLKYNCDKFKAVRDNCPVTCGICVGKSDDKGGTCKMHSRTPEDAKKLLANLKAHGLKETKAAGASGPPAKANGFRPKAAPLTSDKWDSSRSLHAALRKTGCPNTGKQTKGLLDYWRAGQLRAATDMYAYCTLNQRGTASEAQRLVCCGGSKSCRPAKCTKLATIPVDKSAQFGSAVCLRAGETRTWTPGTCSTSPGKKSEAACRDAFRDEDHSCKGKNPSFKSVVARQGKCGTDVCNKLLGTASVKALNTANKYDYSKNVVGAVSTYGSGSSIVFSVKANNDAHLALAATTAHGSNKYEIVIGGWGNTQSQIRTKNQGGTISTKTNYKPLSKTEFRDFWISWAGGRLKVGTGKEVGKGTTFLDAAITDTTRIKQVMVSTGWGSTGAWKFSGPKAGWEDRCNSRHRHGWACCASRTLERPNGGAPAYKWTKGSCSVAGKTTAGSCVAPMWVAKTALRPGRCTDPTKATKHACLAPTWKHGSCSDPMRHTKAECDSARGLKVEFKRMPGKGDCRAKGGKKLLSASRTGLDLAHCQGACKKVFCVGLSFTADGGRCVLYAGSTDHLAAEIRKNKGSGFKDDKVAGALLTDGAVAASSGSGNAACYAFSEKRTWENGACSHPQKTTRTSCLAKTWTPPRCHGDDRAITKAGCSGSPGATWTPGHCSEPGTSSRGACERPTWDAARKECSDAALKSKAACDSAVGRVPVFTRARGAFGKCVTKRGELLAGVYKKGVTFDRCKATCEGQRKSCNGITYDATRKLCVVHGENTAKVLSLDVALSLGGYKLFGAFMRDFCQKDCQAEAGDGDSRFKCFRFEDSRQWTPGKGCSHPDLKTAVECSTGIRIVPPGKWINNSCQGAPGKTTRVACIQPVWYPGYCDLDPLAKEQGKCGETQGAKWHQAKCTKKGRDTKKRCEAPLDGVCRGVKYNLWDAKSSTYKEQPAMKSGCCHGANTYLPTADYVPTEYKYRRCNQDADCCNKKQMLADPNIKNIKALGGTHMQHMWEAGYGCFRYKMTKSERYVQACVRLDKAGDITTKKRCSNDAPCFP